ncbi:type VI secretion system tube protein Hcp [Trinickia sp. LjRoot230]|uniref:type VI secretion system tube protein Hcp n=1 Tax=Trinickia sp. LjRoot230 TaxID=3342288 RepID=UPI003ECF7367
MDNGITISLKGIDGEAGVEKAALNVMNWNWGMSNYPQDRSGGGLSAGTAQISGINFQKQFCKGSPIIMKYLTTGQHFGTAVLEMRKSTGKPNPEVFLTATLTNVYVATYTTGSESATDEMVENVSLVFEALKFDYRPQQTANGALDPAIEFEYNRTTKTTTGK